MSIWRQTVVHNKSCKEIIPRKCVVAESLRRQVRCQDEMFIPDYPRAQSTKPSFEVFSG